MPPRQRTYPNRLPNRGNLAIILMKAISLACKGEIAHGSIDPEGLWKTNEERMETKESWK